MLTADHIDPNVPSLAFLNYLSQSSNGKDWHKLSRSIVKSLLEIVSQDECQVLRHLIDTLDATFKEETKRAILAQVRRWGPVPNFGLSQYRDPSIYTSPNNSRTGEPKSTSEFDDTSALGENGDITSSVQHHLDSREHSESATSSPHPGQFGHPYPLRASNQQTNSLRYLPLCFWSRSNTRLFHVKVYVVDQKKEDDETMFRKMRDVYNRNRGWIRRAFSWYRLRNINRVKVSHITEVNSMG